MADRPNIDSEAIRVHVVLRSTPGLTVEEIHAGLRARHYLAEPRDVIEALARHFNEFRHEQRDGATLWYALHAQFPITMPRPPRRADPPAWAPPPLPPPEVVPPKIVIASINEARRRRGDAVLDAMEATQVLANLAKRATDPRRYTKNCWNCTAVVDEATNEHCGECNWLICWCGACRLRTYVDAHGVAGACRREVWTLSDQEIPDIDFRDRRIVTAKPPAPDANAIRRLSRAAGVRSVFHWSPARAIPSILQLGLLARPELTDRGIAFVPHGYGSAEKQRRLSVCVALSLRPKLGMMGVWSENPVVWELDPEVLVGEGSLFIDGNSASADRPADLVLASKGAGAYQRALAALHLPGGQPEILIPNRIPRAAIIRIHVSDEAMAQTTQWAIEAVGSRLDWDVCWSVDCLVGPPGGHGADSASGAGPFARG